MTLPRGKRYGLGGSRGKDRGKSDWGREREGSVFLQERNCSLGYRKGFLPLEKEKASDVEEGEESSWSAVLQT